MTLDEAIKHCEEKSVGCSECANEYKQLAEWLKELKLMRQLNANSFRQPINGMYSLYNLYPYYPFPISNNKPNLDV